MVIVMPLFIQAMDALKIVWGPSFMFVIIPYKQSIFGLGKGLGRRLGRSECGAGGENRLSDNMKRKELPFIDKFVLRWEYLA